MWKTAGDGWLPLEFGHVCATTDTACGGPNDSDISPTDFHTFLTWY